MLRFSQLSTRAKKVGKGRAGGTGGMHAKSVERQGLDTGAASHRFQSQHDNSGWRTASTGLSPQFR